MIRKLLQDVVVIGYGTAKKERCLTGSVTAIKAEEKNKGLSSQPSRHDCR